MSLQLRYAFTPTPNPIRASPPDGNPNTVDLEVLVTAPATGPVALKSVHITIPIGQPGAGNLSPAVELPPPQYDDSIPWTISVTGGTIEIKPKSGTTSELGGTIVFTLPQIVVDDTPHGGAVGLSILEAYAAGGETTDTNTYELVKQPFDFAVLDFHAEPGVISSIDQTVTLCWKVDSAGQDFDYRLHAPGWMPRECLKDKLCFTAAEGACGVETNELQQTTTFSLDIVDHGQIAGTATLPVRAEIPEVRHDAYAQAWPLGATGRVVAVHWATKDAARVSVELDGQPVDTSAPPDTYLQPYPLAVGGTSDRHDLGITAWPASGTAHDPHPLEPITVRAPTSLELGNRPVDVVFGTGRLGPVALILSADGVTAFDPRFYDPTLRNDPVAIAGDPVAVAGRRDGWAFALSNVTSDAGQGCALTPVNLNMSPTASPPIELRGSDACALGLVPLPSDAPGSFYALVLTAADANVVGYDDDGKLVVQPVSGIANPVRCAVTPDGIALVTTRSGEVVVVDVAAGQPEATPIAAGTSGGEIALSADGSWALVADPDGAELWVIDIASRATVGAPIPVPSPPSSIAIAPDGVLAVVALPQAGALAVVDIPRRRLGPATIPVGGTPAAVAVAPDGSTILVALSDGAITLQL